MTNNKMLIAIKDATDDINNNYDKLIDHATDLLFVLDDMVNNLAANDTTLLNKEAYAKIIAIERETMLIDVALNLNGSAITIDDATAEIIKTNCDDLLKKINRIILLQRNRIAELKEEFGSV